MKKSTFLLILGIVILSCNQNSSSETKKKNKANTISEELTAELKEIQKEGLINGFSVAIVNENGGLYKKGFGFADLHRKKGYSENTVQNIASISKTLIGIALLKAQEMGKLHLDDPIQKHLPFEVKNPYHPNEVITIKHLATHTSSILDSDLYGQKAYILKNADDFELAKTLPSSEEFNLPDSTMVLRDFLKNLLSPSGTWYRKENYMTKKPGERYEYSNVGATLAAYIVELATDQSYMEFTSTHILEPLGMTSSSWTFDTIDMTEHSKLYTVEGEELPFYRLITYPDGGLITSVSDMTNYLPELIKGYSGQGTLLSNESYAVLFSKLLSDANFEERDSDRPFDDEYNSGVFMGHTPIGYIGHTGGDPGVSTFMFFNPKTKIGKMIFVNTDLDSAGAKQFYAIWKKLGDYETRLNQFAKK